MRFRDQWGGWICCKKGPAIESPRLVKLVRRPRWYRAKSSLGDGRSPHDTCSDLLGALLVAGALLFNGLLIGGHPASTLNALQEVLLDGGVLPRRQPVHVGHHLGLPCPAAWPWSRCTTETGWRCSARVATAALLVQDVTRHRPIVTAN